MTTQPSFRTCTRTKHHRQIVNKKISPKILQVESLHIYPIMSTLFIMIKKKINNLEWLEFELLQDFAKIKHFVSLSTPPQQVILANQVHGNHVERIQKPPKNELVCDALSTNTKNLAIGVKHADCQAGILYDPLHHAAACVHCGWRGSVQNIFCKSIEHMRKHFHSSPSDLLFCVGPSLGPENAEFINYKSELPKKFWDYQIKPNYFDFWEITKSEALACGIDPNHIEIAKLDTYSGPFYSYRQDRSQKNRHITAITLL